MLSEETLSKVTENYLKRGRIDWVIVEGHLRRTKGGSPKNSTLRMTDLTRRLGQVNVKTFSFKIVHYLSVYYSIILVSETSISQT